MGSTHAAASRELQHQVEAALGRLRPKHQQILILVAVKKLTYPEIAEHLGISIKRVERRFAYALYELDGTLESGGKPSRRRLW